MERSISELLAGLVGASAIERTCTMESIREYRKHNFTAAIKAAVYAHHASCSNDQALNCCNEPCRGEDLQNALDRWLLYLRGDETTQTERYTELFHSHYWLQMSPADWRMDKEQHEALLERADQELKEAVTAQSLLTRTQLEAVTSHCRGRGDLWDQLVHVGRLPESKLMGALRRHQGLARD